jgi:hypothetical protein
VRIPGELIPIVLFTMVPITMIGVPIARAIARRIEHGVRGGSPSAQPNDVGDRLERIEQAIEAMSIEVERIAEGQRFVTRLMTDRQPERVALPLSANDRNS